MWVAGFSLTLGYTRSLTTPGVQWNQPFVRTSGVFKKSPSLALSLSTLLTCPPYRNQVKQAEIHGRKGSAGMEVLHDKSLWVSSKTQTRLLRADVANGMHHPVDRVRTRTVGVEEGFLVIGASSVIFLKDDNQTVGASHPFVFIEEYKVVDETTFRYALKKKHFLKHDEIIEFSFKMAGADAAQQVLAAMDRNCLIDTKIRESKNEDRREVALSYFDPSLKADLKHEDSSVSQAVHMIDGERFVAKEWYPTKRFIDTHDAHTIFIGPHREDVILIVNGRGICMLHPNDIMEVHAWKTIKSYGACMHKSGDDTFAFKIPDPGRG